MFDALIVVFEHAAAERGLVDDLANVLVDKIIGLQVLIRPQAEALLLRLDDGNFGILLALEPLILAALPAVAIAIYALNLCRSVDAVRILPAGMILIVVCTREKSKVNVSGATVGKGGRREMSCLRQSSAQSQSNAS
jgi:hypothetical protein